MASSASITSMSGADDLVCNFKELYINESIAKNNSEVAKEKAKYMQFLKILLKIKFQKLHNSHLGQQIPAKPVYQEAKRLNVSQENWHDFILNEIKQPQKYIKYIKPDKLKNKKKLNGFGGDFGYQNDNDKTNDLYTIDEEANMTQL